MMLRFFQLLALLCLVGCASFGGEDRYWLKSGQYPADDAVSLLYYAHYVRELAAGEREREVARQQAAFVRDKSPFRRLQYALAVLGGQPGFTDRRLAGQLLEPLLDSQSGGSVLVLAELIEAQLQGLRRADELEKKLSAMREIERSLLQRDRSKP